MYDAFISHAHEDKAAAVRLVENLTAVGLTVWVDHENIRAGKPLVPALQDALLSCKTLVVLWSRDASESLWVNEEWTAVVTLNNEKGADLVRGIVPCRLDDTQLPLFPVKYGYCLFQGPWADGLSCVTDALGGPVVPTPEPKKWEPSDFVRKILRDQKEVLVRLAEGQTAQARELQADLEPLVNEAVREYPDDHYILNLAGYDKKNAYMIRYWNEIQKGQTPADGLLGQAISFFFKALSIEPFDPSALNGLGSVFLLRRDLDAAEFYVRRALARAKEENIPYEHAEHDLRLIQRLRQVT